MLVVCKKYTHAHTHIHFIATVLRMDVMLADYHRVCYHDGLWRIRRKHEGVISAEKDKAEELIRKSKLSGKQTKEARIEQCMA